MGIALNDFAIAYTHYKFNLIAIREIHRDKFTREKILEFRHKKFKVIFTKKDFKKEIATFRSQI